MYYTYKEILSLTYIEWMFPESWTLISIVAGLGKCTLTGRDICNISKVSSMIILCDSKIVPLSE